MATAAEQLAAAKTAILAMLASGAVMKGRVRIGDEEIEYRDAASAKKALDLINDLLARETGTGAVTGQAANVNLACGMGRGYVR